MFKTFRCSGNRIRQCSSTRRPEMRKTVCFPGQLNVNKIMATSARVPTADNSVYRTRELREKYFRYINADPAVVESRRWIEKVTGKRFKAENFRESLADGILLCELVQTVGGFPLGRINRLPTAYAGIDNLTTFFKACEVLGLKKLHLFDVTDLQEVTKRRGDSTSSRAKETQRRLQNVAITILWLAKAAEKQGYQGPTLDFSCFHHLLPEVRYQGKKDRQTRKRHSLGDLENKRRGTETIPLKKRDRVFDKIDVQNRKEKFKNLENEAKKEQVVLEPNRRRSTGAILKILKEKHRDPEEKIPSHKSNKSASFKAPEQRMLYGNQELFIGRDKQGQMELAVLDSKRGRRGSGSDRVTSPPPISLGRKVEVDLKERKNKFEGLDRQAEQQSAVLSGKTRPVTWEASENRPVLKKQNPVDVGFKEKHETYEKLQRQATTERAVLEGKLRPQFDKVDGRPEKIAVASKADVKLREKQRDFERRDYQAQKEKAVLEGNVRLRAGESKGKRPTSMVIPKREQIKLGEKKATFEELDRKAEQDASVLRGDHRQPLTEIDGRSRASKVGLPSDSNVGLLEKQRTFEAMDYQARKESEVLQKNKRQSFGRSVKEPTPLSTSTRPQVAGFQSSLGRKADPSDVRRRSKQDKGPRPVSNYYDYSTFQNGYPEPSKVYHIGATSGDSVDQVFRSESLESHPADKEETIPDIQNENRVSQVRRRDYIDYGRPRYDEPERRPHHSEEAMEIDVSDAKNLSYRDMVRAPQRKTRPTFIRETGNVAPKEEMPWRKEVQEVKYKRNLYPEDEQDKSDGARPSSPRSDLGRDQYRDLVAPPSKKAVDVFATENGIRGNTEEMPWRKEVKDIKRSLSGEEPSASSLVTQVQTAELTKVRPSSMKTRGTFVTRQDGEHEEEMPWRKEVRELKARSRTEDEVDYPDESPVPVAETSSAPNLRRLSYKEFMNAPVRKQKDVFHPEVENDTAKEEMPWRKEVREIARSTANSEDEEEHLEKSSQTLVESAPERDLGGHAHHEPVSKSPRKAKGTFVPYEGKTNEEMPWRKEVREMKRTITEDDQVPRSSSNTHHSPDDEKELLKFSYSDFVGKPRRKSEGFLASEKRQEEEMPWRKEVRELKAKLHEEEQISQSSRPEVQSAPTDAFDATAERSSSNSVSQGTRDSISYRGTEKLSYKDFVVPPSKASEPQGPVQRRSNKVRDLTRKFADIEADKNRIKPSGPPAQKSLVDVAELQRIEREMKTRSWHGFPARVYESDDDFDRDARRRQRTRSQDEEEEKYQQKYHRENISALDEFDDVFQDPEGYFDQMKGPPPERSVGEGRRDPVGASLLEKHNEFKEEAVLSSTNEGYHEGEVSYYSRGFDSAKPIRDEPSQHPKVPDDRIVVKQTWIQSNRIELAEASFRKPEDVKQDYYPRDDNHVVSQQSRSAEPYYRGYDENRSYQAKSDEKRKENVLLQRGELNEEQCFIEHNEFPIQSRAYHPDLYGQRQQDRPRNEPLDTRDQHKRAQPVKVQATNEGDMVFGGPIVVMGRRITNADKSEAGPLPVVPSQLENDFKDVQSPTVQDVPSLAKKDAVEPKRTYRPQVFGVFARNDKPQQRDLAKEHHSSQLHTKELGDSMQVNRRGHMLYLDENDHEKRQDGNAVETSEVQPWYTDDKKHRVDVEGYQSSVSSNTQLHPTVTSVVERQTQQWGSGAFDASPQKDEPRTGRKRVMNFSDDHDDDDDVASEQTDGVFQTAAQPARGDVQEIERRRKQKEKEEMLRQQLRDADYREKYRKEFEEKNRKQRENSKYLMNLQMRAALEPEEDVLYDEDNWTQREVEQQQSEEYNGKSGEGHGSDEDVVNIEAVEEDNWQKKIVKEAEWQNKDTSRHDHPRRKRSDELNAQSNDADFLDESLIHLEYRDPEQEARLRRLKAEEELMAYEAERLRQQEEAAKHPVEESSIVPTEKSPVEFSIDEEAFKKFLEDDMKTQESYCENDNRYFSAAGKSVQVDVSYKDEDFPPKKEREVQGQKIQYPEDISKPQAEVLPMNGYHEERKGHADAPSDVVDQNGNFPGQHGTEPEVNGYDGYSIYKTYIHGESNHVICMSCGTSIEKSSAMYIAELDCYWHVNCFCCVVCGAWFGDEYSPMPHITNSMLHCERCYITSEGERCTEV
ncbi:trichohyalin-like isoform X3 [Montipora foliosa]|uniref:trichohyalin-like isoform X3 n=1 Tax=Montipora foliosa TaxID=591990 RepID=UPI0035F1689C